MPALHMKELLLSLLADVLDDLGFELLSPGPSAARPDVALALVEPGDDAGEVARAAGALTPAPVLLILSFADQALREKARASGARALYALGEPLELLERQLLELTGGAHGAGRRTAVVVEPPSAPPRAPPAEGAVLLDAHGVRLTSTRLEARGKAYALADVRAARAQREAPRMVLPVMIGLAVAIVLPVLLSVLHVLGGNIVDSLELAMVLAGFAVFVTFGRLLLAQDTWWLVLELPDGPARAYGSADREFVHTLLDMVRRALPSPAPAPGAAAIPAATPRAGNA